MARLAHISNRVLAPGEPGVGGLDLVVKQSVPTARALGFNETVRIGWNGRTIQRPLDLDRDLEIIHADEGLYARIPLPESDHKGFYEGTANGFLWPLFHFRPDLALYSAEDAACFMRVNEYFAKVAARTLKPDDEVIVHDYLLMPLGNALVRDGVLNPSTFFLHTPAPGTLLLVNGGVEPDARIFTEDLVETIFCYNLFGLQASRDVVNIKTMLANTGLESASPPHFESEALPGKTQVCDRNTHMGPFPVSIDFAESAAVAREWAHSPQTEAILRQTTAPKIAYCAERLDIRKAMSRSSRAWGLRPENTMSAQGIYSFCKGSRSAVKMFPPIVKNGSAFSRPATT